MGGDGGKDLVAVRHVGGSEGEAVEVEGDGTGTAPVCPSFPCAGSSRRLGSGTIKTSNRLSRGSPSPASLCSCLEACVLRASVAVTFISRGCGALSAVSFGVPTIKGAAPAL